MADYAHTPPPAHIERAQQTDGVGQRSAAESAESLVDEKRTHRQSASAKVTECQRQGQ